jgi:hypothetical protein
MLEVEEASRPKKEITSSEFRSRAAQKRAGRRGRVGGPSSLAGGKTPGPPLAKVSQQRYGK